MELFRSGEGPVFGIRGEYIDPATMDPGASKRTLATHRPTDDPVALPLRHVAAVVAGNALEFYDFMTYSFFAVQIGRAFFPSHNPLSSLLLSLATFGAGFLTRPIGAFVIGRLADRAGRKPAMILSFLLMGIAIVGMALTPSYLSIGTAAPMLIVC